MIRLSRRLLLGIVLAAAAGVGSFAATYVARSGTTAVPVAAPAGEEAFDWLGVPLSQREGLRAHDPAFPSDLLRLRADLTARRAELAAALDDIRTGNEEIRQKSEAVITASAALERRVTHHLLAIRDHLSVDQQKQLFGLCAEGVRRGGGWQWRHGQDGAPGKGNGPGYGVGRGMGMGRGAGRGSGPTMRAGE